mmetsp:Transcript_69200/g.200785  ORF Transcript_69200/g.200785 Transcript_69200/m.200785 type:complete len:285 (-) Transcript_69200:237-1091(-)
MPHRPGPASRVLAGFAVRSLAPTDAADEGVGPACPGQRPQIQDPPHPVLGLLDQHLQRPRAYIVLLGELLDFACQVAREAGQGHLLVSRLDPLDAAMQHRRVVPSGHRALVDHLKLHLQRFGPQDSRRDRIQAILGDECLDLGRSLGRRDALSAPLRGGDRCGHERHPRQGRRRGNQRRSAHEHRLLRHHPSWGKRQPRRRRRLAERQPRRWRRLPMSIHDGHPRGKPEANYLRWWRHEWRRGLRHREGLHRQQHRGRKWPHRRRLARRRGRCRLLGRVQPLGR